MRESDLRGCEGCSYLSSDDDGSDFPSQSWPICEQHPTFSNLSSFPFKSRRKCYRLDFWASDLADEVNVEPDGSDNLKELSDKFNEVYGPRDYQPFAHAEGSPSVGDE